MYPFPQSLLFAKLSLLSFARHAGKSYKITYLHAANFHGFNKLTLFMSIKTFPLSQYKNFFSLNSIKKIKRFEDDNYKMCLVMFKY